MKIILTFAFILTWSISFGQIYTSLDSEISFISNAPLEVISAKSNSLQGVLDIDKKAFAFQLLVKTFKGFNSGLQQIHFYENYMETESYPQAIFRGKLIEDIHSSSHSYRAKGQLEIHGVTKEVIIPVDLRLQDKTARFVTKFEVDLADYQIDIPRIVYQKIAETIIVEAKGTLIMKE